MKIDDTWADVPESPTPPRTNANTPVTETVYLAGKIAAWDWRHKIVPTLRNADADEGKVGSGFYIRNGTIGGLHYSGPFFIACDHGCAHVEGYHGWHINNCTQNVVHKSVITHGDCGRNAAFVNAMVGIDICTILFAWIDSVDCYGTIAEIGYAHGKNRMIFIGFSQEFDDLWFLRKMAWEDGVFPDALTAFNELILK